MAMNDPSVPMRTRMTDFVNTLQSSIVDALEAADPTAPAFKRDVWQRPQGGEGRSCVFAVPFSDSSSASSHPSQETILEKAGVNVSVVHGQLPPAAIKQMTADHATVPFDPVKHPKGLPFFAAGISLVIHPRNPHAPTVHANYRYFELSHPNPEDGGPAPSTTENDKDKDKPIAWWFGGGADLTPSYLYDEDAEHFHRTLKDACDTHGAALYPSLKPWCDEYFTITHRGETRGIGGIFFDDLSSIPHKRIPSSYAGKEGIEARPFTPEEIFAFIRSAGEAFVPSFVPILTKRAKLSYTPEERRWQLLRRGRYVEFNLIYDRGTKFGLMTPGARIESILMSLPETARWEYMSEVGTLEGSEEARLLAVLREPKAWVQA